MQSNPNFVSVIDEVLDKNEELQHEAIQTLGAEGAPILDEMLQTIGAALEHGKIIRKG